MLFRLVPVPYRGPAASRDVVGPSFAPESEIVARLRGYETA